MIIGPFWCEQEHNWIRFIPQKDGFSVEIATRNIKQPHLATEWRTEKNNTFWIINYERDSDELLNESLRLQNGKLYRTDFVLSRLTQSIQVRLYDDAGKLSQYNINKEKNNPFQGRTLSPSAEITPYDKLPLTQEAQYALEIKHKEDAQREVDIQQALEIKNKEAIQHAKEIQHQEWLKWKTQNIRSTLNFAKISSFTKEQSDALCDELNTELFEFSPENYLSFEIYWQALDNAISNITDPIHDKVQRFAARTHIDDEQNLNPDHSEIERAQLFERKQAFAYALLNAEREQLLNHFNIAVPPIQTVPLKSLRIPTARVNIEQDIPPAQFADVEPANEEDELRRAIDDSLSVEYEAELQRVMVNSLADTHPVEPSIAPLANTHPVKHSAAPKENIANSLQPVAQSINKLDVPLVGDANTALIQEAVNRAVTKYQEWYKNEHNHRGLNGFFSWFRHGKDGQDRAKSLYNDILNSTFEEDAITKINSLLTKQSTRYHRHSLASFLLDELTPLKDLPWHGLSPDHISNRYDSQIVSQHLKAFDNMGQRTS